MQSAISFFEWNRLFSPALFRKNVTRFWPIWASYTLVLFLIWPMNLISCGLSASHRQNYNFAKEAFQLMYQTLDFTLVFIALVYGILVAMALFSYLMNNRSVGLFHSLPIHREGLFCTNWLSGACFFVVPNAVIFLVILLVELVFGGVRADVLIAWFVALTMMDLFFFSLGIFCAMFTGHILALPVFYGIINLLVAGIVTLVQMALSILLVGFDRNLYSFAPVRWLTPMFHFNSLLGESTSGFRFDDSLVVQVEPLLILFGYCLVVGVALCMAAIALYRMRQLERAGDLVTVGWVRPVFQYGLGACVGLAGGAFICCNFFDTPTAYVISALIFAAIGAFAGRMLLKKTLRVFADGWKGVAVLCVCLFVLLGGAHADLFGYQKWVPDPNKVESIAFDGVQSEPYDDGHYYWNDEITDPDDIAALIDFHAALVQNGALQTALKDRDFHSEYDANLYQIKGFNSLDLTYYMKDGSIVQRRYDSIPIVAEDLQSPDTYACKLQDFINRPNMIWNVYLFRLRDSDSIQAIGGELVHLKAKEESDAPDLLENASETVPAAKQDTVAEEPENSKILSVEEAQKLWEAIKTDLAAGRIGRRYLLDDKERQETCYISDIQLSLAAIIREKDGTSHNETRDATFTLQTTSTATIQALDELGYLDRMAKREERTEKETHSENQ